MELQGGRISGGKDKEPKPVPHRRVHWHAGVDASVVCCTRGLCGREQREGDDGGSRSVTRRREGRSGTQRRESRFGESSMTLEVCTQRQEAACTWLRAHLVHRQPGCNGREKQHGEREQTSTRRPPLAAPSLINRDSSFTRIRTQTLFCPVTNKPGFLPSPEFPRH